MGVQDHGPGTASLVTLDEWATAVSAALNGSDVTVDERISAAMPTGDTLYELGWTATGSSLGTGGYTRGRYVKMGSLVYVHGMVSFGAGSDIGTGEHYIQLPSEYPPDVTYSSGFSLIGSVTFHRPSQWWKGECYLMDGVIKIGFQGNDGLITAIGRTEPFAWDDNDFIRISLIYRA